MRYADKVLAVPQCLDQVKDSRKEPRIPTAAVVRSIFVMFLARLGSLNALETRSENRFWQHWVGAELASADSMGRIASLLDHGDLRAVNLQLYQRLKRNKALKPPPHGLMVLSIDGHESHSSYRRCCAACLKRTISTAKGDRIQYYHRQVVAMLSGHGLNILLDLEPQRAGEDEVATALRLLERICDSYSRAIDVVNADALYADPRVFDLLGSRGLDVLTVLKDERRDLIRDARDLCELVEPKEFEHRKRHCRCWDLQDLRSWPSVNRAVRVVRSQESWAVTRQLDGQVEELSSEWLWVTTLPEARASSKTIVELGHRRWVIENEGFNELAKRWHADHVYRHEASAMLSFALLCLVAFNLFHAFYFKNLKPALRASMNMLHVAEKIIAELDGKASVLRPP